jgi:sulfotransferase family protein
LCTSQILPRMPTNNSHRQYAPKLDFCILGASKSGKSALYTYLRTHPQIFMPEMDSNFYVNDGKKNQHSYGEIFAGATHGQLIGEASGRYFLSEYAVPNILKDNPHARFIIMVRNPVDMAQSRHSHLLRRGYEDERSFPKAWDLQDERAAGDRIPPLCPDPKILLYRNKCSFAGEIERLFQWIPRGSLLVHVFEEFFADPRASYERTLAFLGLPPDARRTFERINELGVPRNWLLHDFAHKPPLLYRMLKRSFNAVGLRPGLAFFRWTIGGKKTFPTMGPTFRRRLEVEFRPEIARLETILGRDLDVWKSI